MRSTHYSVFGDANKVKVLNVAGNRGSVNPGIGERVERFMLAVLRKLAEG